MSAFAKSAASFADISPSPPIFHEIGGLSILFLKNWRSVERQLSLAYLQPQPHPGSVIICLSFIYLINILSADAITTSAKTILTNLSPF